MDQKIAITTFAFFQAGTSSQVSFDLADSTPVFLSGPAGQGKEMIQSLLTHWYLPAHSVLSSDESQPDLLLYQWSGNGKRFVSAHSRLASKPVVMFISGEIEASWGNDTPIHPIRSWKKELEKEGRTVSNLLNGLEEWDRWLTNQRSALSKKQQELFFSPRMNPETLSLLRYRPEPHLPGWEQVFANRILQLFEVPSDFQQKILCYFQERTTLLRHEKLGRSLPGLRKWNHRKEQIRQERQLLTAQWPDIYHSHQQEKEKLEKHLQNIDLPLPEESRLDQLRMRLSWVQWEIEQKTEPSASAASLDTPDSWWKARKILASEHRLISASILELQQQLSMSNIPDTTEEEVRIGSQIKKLTTQQPEKIANLERLKMKLEWLRKEKEEEEQTLAEVHRSELARIQHKREGLEIHIRELEAETRRPKNTFRHWLEKNYPDWEHGPGKVLHPAVLESRGMFPALERINDLFFGIRIHIDELPSVQNEQELNHNPAEELEEVRRQVAAFQIQVKHEEKLLQNRYKQKIRPLQKNIQQAEYDLQLHTRTLHQLRERKKEIRQKTIFDQETSKLKLEYRVQELQAALEPLALQIEGLDTTWEQWLEENHPRKDGISLKKLQKAWAKELTQQEKTVGKARKKKEKDQVLAAAALANWSSRDQRFSNLIQSGELPLPDKPIEKVASLTIEQWEQRWEVMEAEEIGWDQDHQSWIEEHPALHEYLDLGLEEFEETEIETKRSELARKWFGELSTLSQILSTVRNTYFSHVKTLKKWQEIWQEITRHTTLSNLSPETHLSEHPFWRAVEMLNSLVEDHQHASAGNSLFSQQDPQQTLIRTLHVLDNLYEGWMIWKDGLTRMNLSILRLPGLSQAHQQDAVNYLYHLTLILAQSRPIPGVIPIPEPERIPPEVISNMTPFHSWVICSQYPLAIKGDHLWVTAGKKKEQWEALPFAMG